MRKRQNAKPEVVTAMTTVFQGLFDHELEKAGRQPEPRACMHACRPCAARAVPEGAQPGPRPPLHSQDLMFRAALAQVIRFYHTKVAELGVALPDQQRAAEELKRSDASSPAEEQARPESGGCARLLRMLAAPPEGLDGSQRQVCTRSWLAPQGTCHSRLTHGGWGAQARALGQQLGQLQASAEEVTQLLGYVSLNEAAVRKILKKAAKNLQMKATYGPGLMSMRIEHPHEPGWKLLQVGTAPPLGVHQS